MSKSTETETNSAYTLKENSFFKAISDEIQPQKWLLKGLIEQNSLNVIFGPSGEKKSFVVIDMALHVLNGKDWYGHRVKQDNVTVLYIAGEGAVGINLRVHAACKHHNFSHKGFLISKSAVDLFEGSHTTEADNDFEQGKTLSYVDMLVEEIKQIDGNVWVILDTLNRNFSGEENSSKDMAVLWNNIDKLREAGATFTLIHHTGHGAQDRARGSSSIKGAMDGEIKVTTNKQTGLTTVENTKAKNVATSSSITMIGELIEFGEDEDGDTISSLAMIPAEDTSVSDEDLLIAVAEQIYSILPQTQKVIDEMISTGLGISLATAKRYKKPKILKYLEQKHQLTIVKKQWIKKEL